MAGSSGPRLQVRGVSSQVRTLLRRRWQLVAVGGFVVSALVWFVFVNGAARNLETVRADRSVLERRAGELAADLEAAQSSAGAEAVESLAGSAERYDELLPDLVEQVSLLVEIPDLLTQAGVRVLEFTQSRDGAVAVAGPDEKTTYTRFSVVFQGSIDEIAVATNELGRYAPLITIYSAKIIEDGKNPGFYTFSAEVRVWSSKDPGLSSFRTEPSTAPETTTAPDAPPVSTPSDTASTTPPATTTPATTPPATDPPVADPAAPVVDDPTADPAA
jgi:hypothetical protein